MDRPDTTSTINSQEAFFRMSQESVDVYRVWGTARALCRLLQDHGPTLWIEMSEVEFMDSTALGVLLGLLRRARAQSGDVYLLGINPRIKRILQINGLDRVFNLSPTRNEPIALPNFAGANLEGSLFEYKNFAGADFRRANLRKARLLRANLWGADLSEASLEGADLTDVSAQASILRQAHIGQANLTGANLAGADLYRTDLTKTVLAHASLEEATLHNAVLCSANLQEANLQRADFSEADLRNANLKGANLSGTILKRANLGGAVLDEAILTNVSLAGANLEGAQGLFTEEGLTLLGLQLVDEALMKIDQRLERLSAIAKTHTSHCQAVTAGLEA